MCRVPISRVCVTFVYKEQTENEIKETEKKKGNSNISSCSSTCVWWWWPKKNQGRFRKRYTPLKVLSFFSSTRKPPPGVLLLGNYRRRRCSLYHFLVFSSSEKRASLYVVENFSIEFLLFSSSCFNLHCRFDLFFCFVKGGVADWNMSNWAVY